MHNDAEGTSQPHCNAKHQQRLAWRVALEACLDIKLFDVKKCDAEVQLAQTSECADVCSYNATPQHQCRTATTHRLQQPCCTASRSDDATSPVAGAHRCPNAQGICCACCTPACCIPGLLHPWSAEITATLGTRLQTSMSAHGCWWPHKPGQHSAWLQAERRCNSPTTSCPLPSSGCSRWLPKLAVPAAVWGLRTGQHPALT